MRFNIKPIIGDASFRTFYRLTLGKKSKIIILSRKEKYKNLIAYTSINQFLRSNNILTPKLYSHNFPKGMIVVEDFGNLSFYTLLLKKKNKIIVYKKIVDLLLKIQKIKPKSKIKKIGKGIHKIEKYSNRHLFQESDLFFDWYLPLFLNKKQIQFLKNFIIN